MGNINRFYVGQSEEESIVVTENLIYETADFSGDYNPIHTSKEYATKTRFGTRIAHSLVCEALISKVIGMKLPGAGAVFIKVGFTCLCPVIIDDIITATATIKELDVARSLMNIKVECRNQRGEVVVDCDTKVLYLDVSEEEF